MKITILYISVFLLLLVGSCEQEARNVEYPEFLPKVVISAYFSPDKTVQKVYIGSNTNLYGNRMPYNYGSATVRLINNGVETILGSSQAGFFLPSRVKEGETYTLRVETSTGLKAEASCTVPPRRDLNIGVDTMRIYPDHSFNQQFLPFPSSFLNADIYITDPAGEENYYMFIGEQITFRNGQPYIYPSYFRPVFSDKGRDGQRFRVHSTSLMTYTDSVFLKIYILNTDRIFYDFYKSAENYSDGEDPFTEASPVFSNVTGGLGIFASYTIDSLWFRVK
jgi:hypothetical protein